MEEIFFNRFYPSYERKIFTNRVVELNLLGKTLINIKHSIKSHKTIIGLRKIGKTSLIKEFIYQKRKEKIGYVNLQEIMGVPESFCLKLVSHIIYSIFKEKELVLDYNELLEKSTTNNIKSLTKFLTRYLSVMQQKKIDYSNLIKLSFDFMEELAEEIGPLLIFLDEFQEVLYLNKIQGIHNILAVLRPFLENSRKVNYILSGSSVSLIEKSILNKDSPLFNLSERITLKRFTKQDSLKLMIKILGKEVVHYNDLIFYYTQAHPYYLAKFCEHLRDHYKEINEFNIKRSYLYILLNKDGMLYSLFSYVYDTSLEKVSGHILIKSILSVLSLEEGLTLSEISEKVNRKPGQVKKSLEELKEVDILTEKDGNYYFLDPIFRFWLANKEHGIKVDLIPNYRDVWSIVKQLEEKYLQASTELGKTKEYEYKVKLEKEFKIKVENYNKDNIEFDLLGKKNNVWYIFEIKHRNKPTNYQNIKKFLEKINKSEFKNKKKKLFFISKSSFTKESEKLMEKNKIILMDHLN